MAERIDSISFSQYLQESSKRQQAEKWFMIGGFGGALLSIATGLPSIFGKTFGWVGVIGTAAYGIDKYLESRKKK